MSKFKDLDQRVNENYGELGELIEKCLKNSIGIAELNSDLAKLNKFGGDILRIEQQYTSVQDKLKKFEQLHRSDLEDRAAMIKAFDRKTDQVEKLNKRINGLESKMETLKNAATKTDDRIDVFYRNYNEKPILSGRSEPPFEYPKAAYAETTPNLRVTVNKDTDELEQVDEPYAEDLVDIARHLKNYLIRATDYDHTDIPSNKEITKRLRHLIEDKRLFSL